MANTADENAQNWYETLTKEKGEAFQRVGWNSQHGQLLRYEIISDLMAQKANSDGSFGEVLEIGCGNGGALLFGRVLFPMSSWVGWDLVEASVFECNSYIQKNCGPRTPSMVAQHRPASDLGALSEGSTDWVIGSGIWARHIAEPGVDMLDLFTEFMVDAWAAARVGVVMNFLDKDWMPPAGIPEGEEAHWWASKTAVFRVLSKELAGLGEITVRSGYLPHDFTVAVYKN